MGLFSILVWISIRERRTKLRKDNWIKDIIWSRKWRRTVIVEIEEDNVLGKSMTQRDQNAEDEHQTNIEGNEISKA